MTSNVRTLHARPAQDTRSPVRAAPEPEAFWDHDPQAERAVLAAVLLDGERASEWGVWKRVSAILVEEDFHDPRHRVMWVAFGRVLATGGDLDVITGVTELRRMERLNTVGGAQAIGELTDEIPIIAHCETHARLVKEYAARRAVAEIARGLIVRAHDLGRPIALTLAGVQAALNAVPLPNVTVPTMEGVVDHYFATLAHEVPAGAPPVPTAWGDLDHALLGGLRPGHYLLVGLPGTGKTTLALLWAVAVALRTGPVLFIEKEQDRTELGDALLAMVAGIAFAKVRDARERPTAPVLSADEMARLTVAGNTLHSLPLRIMDESTPGCPSTVAEVVALARGMNPPPALVVIDNLGELKARNRKAERDAQMEEKMGDLRHARKLLGIPILTLAHPNREATKGAMMRRLRASDVAGGSAAEKMCDGVLLVHREDMHPTRDHKKEPAEEGVLEVYSPKVRGVGVVFCELLSQPATHRYVSRRRRDPPTDPRALASAVRDGSLDTSFAGEALPVDSTYLEGELAFGGRAAPAVDDTGEGEPW